MIVILFIIIGIILFLSIISLTIYLVIAKKYNGQFNHRQELNPLVKSYTKDDYNLLEEKIIIPYKNDNIVGYLYNLDNYDSNKLIIFCHGFFSTKEAYIQDVGYLCQNNYQVFLYDSFGTNESSSNLESFGSFMKALDIVINYFNNNDNYKNKEIYIVGHSLGAYSAGNIVKIHKQIKGICLLAPLYSIYDIIYSRLNNKLLTNICLNIDNKNSNGYSKYNLHDSLKDYKGKILIIHSLDDNIINTNYVKDKLKDLDNIEYITVNNRLHNPEYKIEAVNKLNQFVSELSKVNPNDYSEFYSKQDFKSMGELDNNIMDKIVEFLR